MNVDKRIEQMSTVQLEALELFRKKNNDYGDAFATYGPIGVIVRMGDKISRLNSVTKTGINLVNTESVRDTLIDLHNYSAMAIMLLDETSYFEKYSSELFPNTPKNTNFQANSQVIPPSLTVNQIKANFPINTDINTTTNTRTPSPGPILQRRTSWTSYPHEKKDTNNIQKKPEMQEI